MFSAPMIQMITLETILVLMSVCPLLKFRFWCSSGFFLVPSYSWLPGRIDDDGVGHEPVNYLHTQSVLYFLSGHFVQFDNCYPQLLLSITDNKTQINKLFNNQHLIVFNFRLKT